MIYKNIKIYKNITEEQISEYYISGNFRIACFTHIGNDYWIETV